MDTLLHHKPLFRCNAAGEAVRERREREAKSCNCEPDAVIWEDGHARPASSNVGDFKPLSLAEIAAKAGKTGGPINGHAQLNAQGAGPGLDRTRTSLNSSH